MPAGDAGAGAPPPATAYEVTAVRYAALRGSKRELFHRYEAYGEPDSELAIAAAHRTGRVRMTGGVEEILDGVTAHSMGGHPPGQEVTVVAAAHGDVVCGSDTVHFHGEFELDRPFAVVVDLPQMHHAYDRMRELVARPGAVLVPSHDPEVLTRFPAGDPHVDGNAVRLG